MEEHFKRRTATKKRVSEFRTTAPDITDKKIVSLVESMFPNKYFSLDVGIEVVKELYREDKELTEENFNHTLCYLDDIKQLLKWDKEYQKSSALAKKKIELVEKIYKDASERDVFLSQYPEFDDDMKKYL